MGSPLRSLGCQGSLGAAHAQDAEFGYFSLVELEALDLSMRFIFTDQEVIQQVIVERDLDWRPKELRVAVPLESQS